jgi:PAS domain-containing protein
MATDKLVRNAVLVGAAVVASAFLIMAASPPAFAIHIVSDIFPLLLSVAGAFLAYRILRRERKDRGSAWIWGWMTLGLACWAAGEITWTVLSDIHQAEIPYPSAADVFWVVGYIPVILSLGYQLYLLRAPLTRVRLAALVAAVAVMICLAFGLVVVPILADPESGSALVMFFNLAYPVGDIVLLSLGLVLGFVFVGGQLALPWAVITAGIFLDALSDLLFSFGTWNGLYYPDGRLNFLSGLFDILYVGAYTVWCIGLFLRWRLPDPGRDVNLQEFIPEAGKDFLVLVDKTGRVVFADPALTPILGSRRPEEVLGKSFGSLFHLPRGYETTALRKAERAGLSDDYSITLGLSKAKYRLRLVATSDPQQFRGFDLLLHPEAEPSAEPFDREAALLGQVAARARMREIARQPFADSDPLRTYFNTAVELLHILASRAGGTGVGAAFEADLNRKARAKGFHFRLRNGSAEWGEQVTYPGLYRDLLKEAVRYATQVLSADTIAAKLQEIETYIDPEIVREAEENGLSAKQWLGDGSA